MKFTSGAGEGEIELSYCVHEKNKAETFMCTDWNIIKSGWLVNNLLVTWISDKGLNKMSLFNKSQ